MSLTTPEKTRTLQRKLYRKAKEKKPPRRGRLRPELFSVCLTMKLVGKPDAGNRHVRFDERGQETECCHMAQATAPVLDSTQRPRRAGGSRQGLAGKGSDPTLRGPAWGVPGAHRATTMVVHFRETPYGLAMSLVESRRENGKVRHEHL